MGHHKPLSEQFWAHVERGPTEACWEWRGSRRPTGYGQMMRMRKNLKAHRISWELHVGQIPQGMCVLHRCDNPPCCNPAHLALGSHQENIADMVTKARGVTTHYRGERNPASKLTASDVLLIRSMAAQGAAIRGIARLFSLHPKTVRGIVRRETWSHV